MEAKSVAPKYIKRNNSKPSNERLEGFSPNSINSFSRLNMGQTVGKKIIF